MADDTPTTEPVNITDTERARNLSTGSFANIRVKVGENLQLKVLNDPDAPDVSDISATLTSQDGKYNTTLKFAEAKAADGGKLLIFKRVKPGKKYSLQIDPGAGGKPYTVFREQMVTKELAAKMKAAE